MTDITELAQNHELRNKVNHRLYAALEFQGTSGEHATITLSIDECKSIIAAMDEHLALVEALEKAKHEARVDWEAAASLNVESQELKRRIAELEEAEQKLCAANVTLDARAELAERRLAEVESRTVKMPEPFKLAKSSSGLTYYFADDVDAALTAAGIKWEAE